MKGAKIFFLAGLAGFAALHHSVAAERAGTLELFQFVGLNHFDASITDSTGPVAGFRVNYNLTEKWAAELSLYQSWVSKSGDYAVFGGGSLGAMYYPELLSTPKLSPYLGVGLGTAYYDYDNQTKDGFEREWALHYGAGAKYAMTENWFLGADIRQIVTHGPTRPNLMATLGISFNFGKSQPPQEEPKAFEPSSPQPVEKKPEESPQPVEKKPEELPRPTQKNPEPPPAPPPVSLAQDPKPPATKKEPPPPPPPVVEEPKEISPSPAPVKASQKVEATLRFGLNSAKMKKEYSVEIEKLVKLLKENPGATIILSGHADSTGEEDYNQRLSERRAVSIEKILVKTYKIDAGRIKTEGFGEKKPANSTDTRAGRQKNRRVEAVVTIP